MDINFLAVLVAGLLSWFLGYFWYGTKMFGKKWMEFINSDSEEMNKDAKKAMFLTLITGLVLAYVLAVFVNYAGARSISEGFFVGFWAWLGFVVTTSSASVLFEKRPVQLFMINAGFHLVDFVLMGALLAIWK